MRQWEVARGKPHCKSARPARFASMKVLVRVGTVIHPSRVLMRGTHRLCAKDDALAWTDAVRFGAAGQTESRVLSGRWLQVPCKAFHSAGKMGGGIRSPLPP